MVHFISYHLAHLYGGFLDDRISINWAVGSLENKIDKEMTK